jgi:hypothetical protein
MWFDWKENFIREAKKIWGDRFLYHKVERKKSKEKIKIICKKHGEFGVYLHDFLVKKKQSCKQCFKDEKLIKNKNNFLKQAKDKYGDTFCYSLLDYKGMRKKIKVICPKHGVFETNPYEHLRGKGGCYKCNKKIRKKNIEKTTTNTRIKILEKHINKANKKFKNKFNYSYLDYNKNLHTSNKIICPIHDEFYMSIYDHLRSPTGCKKCSKDTFLKKPIYTLQEFIKKANKKYNNKFDYSIIKKIERVRDKVKIICPNPNHGVFEQQINLHLSNEIKYGCPKCANIYGQKETRYTQKTFLNKCYKIWGLKIDYSFTKFNGVNNIITVTCKEHSNTYEITANNFLKGLVTCEYCRKKYGLNKSSRFVKGRKAYLYIFKITNLYSVKENQLNILFNNALKFGITHNVENRYKTLKRRLNGNLKLIALYKGDDDIIYKTERLIKKNMRKQMFYINKKIMKYGFSETVEHTKQNIETILNYCNNNKHLKKVKSLEKHFV